MKLVSYSSSIDDGCPEHYRKDDVDDYLEDLKRRVINAIHNAAVIHGDHHAAYEAPSEDAGLLASAAEREFSK